MARAGEGEGPAQGRPLRLLGDGRDEVGPDAVDRVGGVEEAWPGERLGATGAPRPDPVRRRRAEWRGRHADRLAPVSADERRLAVIDMGSNTFRLVVFRYRPGGSFQLVDEIRDVVRLSAGAGPDGPQRRGDRARLAHDPALRRLLRGGGRGRRGGRGDERRARRGEPPPTRSTPLGGRGAEGAGALRRGGGPVRLPRRGQQHHARATGTCSTWAAAASRCPGRRAASSGGRSRARSGRCG